MLSYQHIYHAGNMADLHKHALLATMLAQMAAKPKPMSYIETHAGRGLYDLDAPEALRTGEAQAGITRALGAGWFAADQPLMLALTMVRAEAGPDAYPGSPRIAAALLRPGDTMHLAELHPGEHAALITAMRGTGARIYGQDGFTMAHSICPPEPRRGLMLIDPSWEVKSDYQSIPAAITKLHRKWNVGVIALWYPILRDNRHKAMLDRLRSGFVEALCSEVSFPPAQARHGMIGSGMFVINPPWRLANEARRLEQVLAR
ncbi:23S rRNA (adenine(2030)-N(6))-methyltransferase RlmJ [Aquicoccus sp.]|uniref:23S rRNA (adenine(2030)-N(6))-methyltransferase RlmJ n=1 Tax=Aquicoccus sp. TaxID=2055851 RepID=UPI0035681700